MRSLYIFNPDTDYALASGSVSYTPSRAVGEMIRNLTLLPALWADKGAVILSSVPKDEALRNAHAGIMRAIREKDLEITDWESLGRDFRETDFNIQPWGWNQVLHARLRRTGIRLPQFTEDDWQTRLELAHRRGTISLNRFLATRLPELEIPEPVEFSEIGEVMKFRSSRGELYLKDPWSSSGRGVLYTGGISDDKIRQWTAGVIRRHGSVMAETVADKKTDCSTLWEIRRDGFARFMGFSMFKTSPQGHYLGQIIPDVDGLQFMKEELPFLSDNCFCRRLLEAQKEWLEANSAGIPGYAGIDMLLERSGNLRPGIEINRRMTMGTASCLIARNCPADLPLPSPFIRIGFNAGRDNPRQDPIEGY